MAVQAASFFFVILITIFVIPRNEESHLSNSRWRFFAALSRQSGLKIHLCFILSLVNHFCHSNFEGISFKEYQREIPAFRRQGSQSVNQKETLRQAQGDNLLKCSS